MRKSIFVKASILVMALFMLSACAKGLGIASAAPDLTLRDLDGNTVTLSQFKGKVIILDFFATWCPPCRQEIPDFVELQKQYGSQGFTMVGVSLSRLEETRAFAELFGMIYPVLIDDGYAKTVYGPIRSIPMTIIIGKDFKIAKKYIGYRPKEVFEADVRALLGQ